MSLPGIGAPIADVGAVPRPFGTYVGTPASNTGNQSSYTFSNVPIGEAAEDRLVVALLSFGQGNAGASRQVNSVTIGGVTAGLAGALANGRMPTAIAYLVVPAGATATIIANLSGSVSNGTVSVFTLSGYQSSTPHDAAAQNTSSTKTSESVSVDVPEDAAMFAVVDYPGTSAPTVTGLALDVIRSKEGEYHLAGHNLDGADGATTVTATAPSGYFGVRAAVWR